MINLRHGFQMLEAKAPDNKNISFNNNILCTIILTYSTLNNFILKEKFLTSGACGWMRSKNLDLVKVLEQVTYLRKIFSYPIQNCMFVCTNFITKRATFGYRA